MSPQRLTDRGKLLAVYDPDTETLSIKANGMKAAKIFDLKTLKAPKPEKTPPPPLDTTGRDAV